NDDILLASSSDDGATFSDPVNISNSSGLSSSLPQVAASGSNVHVVWQENDDILLASSSDDGATFSDPVNISTASSPQVAASGSNVHVVWQENDDILLASSSDDGATFSDPVNISNSTGLSLSPTIGISSDEIAQIVWAEVNADETGSEIYLSTVASGESPSACPIDLSSSVGFSFSPRLAPSDDSRLHIVWEDSAPGVFEVQIQHSVDPLEPVAVINPLAITSLKVGESLEISG